DLPRPAAETVLAGRHPAGRRRALATDINPVVAIMRIRGPGHRRSRAGTDTTDATVHLQRDVVNFRQIAAKNRRRVTWCVEPRPRRGAGGGAAGQGRAVRPPRDHAFVSSFSWGQSGSTIRAGPRRAARRVRYDSSSATNRTFRKLLGLRCGERG